MNNMVAKCKFCGTLYEVYSMMVGDQSVCPKCRAEAQRNMAKGTSASTTLIAGDVFRRKEPA